MKEYGVKFKLQEGSDEFWEEVPSLKEISDAIKETLYFDGWFHNFDDVEIEVKQIGE